MSCNKNNPIALISGFKSGTWLMRKVLSSITGMDFYEPDIIPGKNKYYNSEQLKFIEKHFYSWHLVPTKEVVEKLNENHARTIFLVRNIYDLVVSIYYHFYNNIDADIGRGNNKDRFLRQFNLEDGLSLIITGFNEGAVRWGGMKEIIEHYNMIFKASKQCDCLLVEYEKLVNDKNRIILRIADYLMVDMCDQDVDITIEKTSFMAMKDAAKNKNKGYSHFREGKSGLNRERLSLFHQILLRQMIMLSAPDIYKNAQMSNMEMIVKYDPISPLNIESK